MLQEQEHTVPNNERDRIEHPPTVSSKPGEPLRQDQVSTSREY
ncbi:MAG: hypothetical protein ACJLS2_01115 [Microcella pacifica]